MNRWFNARDPLIAPIGQRTAQKMAKVLGVASKWSFHDQMLEDGFHSVRTLAEVVVLPWPRDALRHPLRDDVCVQEHH
jgi:hypothetical protein